MAQLQRQPSWQTKLVSVFVLSGAIFPFSNLCVLAQNITLDGTLGTQQTLTGPNYLIPQGAGRTVGNNLFQSFGKFNLDTDEVAKFESSASIRNILARVTGGTLSSINGLIQIQGSNANLFLLNPNGIIFGPNAQLDIRGSFLASTANSFVFQNGSEFSAIHPQQPDLLAINVPIGLQYGGQPGTITSQANLLTDSTQSLALVGGQVNLNGASLAAPGGSIELAGVSGVGTVGLTLDSNQLRLNLLNDVPRADINLTNNATVIIGAGVGGRITVNARNLELQDGQILTLFPVDGLENPPPDSSNNRSGDIYLNATGTITLRGDENGGYSVIQNDGYLNDKNGGDITIETGLLKVTDGSFLGIGSTVQGDNGNLSINARDAVVINGSIVGSFAQGEGKGGAVNITTGALTIKDSELGANTSGQGDAGNLTVNALNGISLDRATVGSGASASGRGGNVSIATDKLSITNGAQLINGTSGTGNAGDLTINAHTIAMDGVAVINGQERSSSIENNVFQGSEGGRGGNVSISTESFAITNGAQVGASTFGRGDAGSVIISASNAVTLDGVSRSGRPSALVSQVGTPDAVGAAGGISINTKSLSVNNGASLFTSTYGLGDAGNITIKAQDNISVNGRRIAEDLGTFTYSTIFSDVRATSKGRAGDISITAGSFFLSEGARIGSATLGQGDAGNITINARDTISLVGGTGIFGQQGGYIASNVETSGTGKGGNLQIATGKLFLSNGAELQALTRGNGDAGDITIDARDAVVIDGVRASGFSSGLFTSVERGALGQGRNITVNTPLLRLSNGGVINARTLNNKPGGNITINADTFEAINGGQVITTTYDSGQAGNITLNVTDKVILSGSDPTYKNRILQFAQGNPDNTGAVSGLYANTTLGSTGNAGSIFIDPRSVLVQDGATIAVNSQGSGQGGNIEIQAEKLTLDNQGLISAETASNQGGDINLNSNLLLLRHGAQISTNAGTGQQGGDGGNININSKFIVAVPNENSDITANAFNGSGGKIQINATNIFGIAPLSRQDLERLRPLDLDPSQLSSNDITAVSQQNPSLSGTIQINTPDADPSRGLAELPTNVVDVSGQIANSCIPGSRQSQSSFIATGRGGLPISPNQPLQDTSMLSNWVRVGQQPAAISNQVQVTPILAKSARQIVEAQNWVVDANGDIVLVAQAPQANPRSSWQASVSCPAL
ncbi:filamentous hemagglutinin N-terminal domain-containing protein [Nostoc sp. 106C]|uniref:two-partner secretion domain-containing protein n=1 Tax=Nostoc sp. 106C TaxID=1932667 RepID=UPI000A372B23|nr:filamentous hemagglutinin N-terminal domain-containing protein [Nostoc sp. 106C]OUL34021.1 hypothetical protein BV375_05430 [Nostoc sp. 106C]